MKQFVAPGAVAAGQSAPVACFAQIAALDGRIALLLADSAVAAPRPNRNCMKYRKAAISKDNFFFSIRAVDTPGPRSVPVTPAPAGSSPLYSTHHQQE
jgi:hypothetical protein